MTAQLERQWEAKRKEAAAAAAAALVPKAAEPILLLADASLSPQVPEKKEVAQVPSTEGQAGGPSVPHSTAPAAMASENETEQGASKRRRRGGPVDYAELNRQLEKEAAEK